MEQGLLLVVMCPVHVSLGLPTLCWERAEQSKKVPGPPPWYMLAFAATQSPQESWEVQGSLAVLTTHASEENTDYPVLQVSNYNLQTQLKHRLQIALQKILSVSPSFPVSRWECNVFCLKLWPRAENSHLGQIRKFR